jgi:hypothetical protein
MQSSLDGAAWLGLLMLVLTNYSQILGDRNGDCSSRSKFGTCITNLGTVIKVVTRCFALIHRWEGSKVLVNSSQVS